MKDNVWRMAALTVACAVGVVLWVPSEAEAFHGHHWCWSSCDGERAMSLRMSAGRLSLAGDELDIDGMADLGGMGLAWRWELSRRGGPEVLVAGYSRMSDDATVREKSGMVSVGWVRYFWQHPKHRWYGTVGWVGMLTQRETEGEDHVDRRRESGASLGGGYEYVSRRGLVLSADARILYLKLKEHDDVQGDEEDERRYDERRLRTTSDRDRRFGITGNVAVGYRW